MDIDKKVYNVEKDLVNAGGTAMDVMKNVPSVNVDIDGNLTLRNAPPITLCRRKAYYAYAGSDSGRCN